MLVVSRGGLLGVSRCARLSTLPPLIQIHPPPRPCLDQQAQVVANTDGSTQVDLRGWMHLRSPLLQLFQSGQPRRPPCPPPLPSRTSLAVPWRVEPAAALSAFVLFNDCLPLARLRELVDHFHPRSADRTRSQSPVLVLFCWRPHSFSRFPIIRWSYTPRAPSQHPSRCYSIPSIFLFTLHPPARLSILPPFPSSSSSVCRRRFEVLHRLLGNAS
jgi:hypothetical protein